MRRVLLEETDFKNPSAGWALPKSSDFDCRMTPEGAVVSTPRRTSPTPEKYWLGDARGVLSINGPGVHTRNGDAIELHFRSLEDGKGVLRFGFCGGFEAALVTVDFAKGQLSLTTTDWSRSRSVKRLAPGMVGRSDHVLLIEKTEGGGNLVKKADLRVFLDGEQVLLESDLDIIPEMGVAIEVNGTCLLLRRFIHKGVPSGIPEYLNVGGWQMLNEASIDENVQSLLRGLEEASDKGVQLLVTPETSLTGLFPAHRVTRNRTAVMEAESKIRKFIQRLKNAPCLILGLPAWDKAPGTSRKKARYNVCRVYDPDGEIVSTHAKIHSCEYEFWHGHRLQEFDIHGVPVCMHICHDGRYPEVWTLPVMFGARLIVHPSNGGRPRSSIDSFEAATGGTAEHSSNAFYVHVNAGGGSYIMSPGKFARLLVVSSECQRDAETFPLTGEPEACLFHANLRVADAFGYWPVRSFRASEAAAAAYVDLYRALGGKRLA